MTPAVDRKLAAIGAENDRPIVGRFDNDRHRPRDFQPLLALVRHMSQQLDHCPSPHHRGSHGLGAGVASCPQVQILSDEPPQLLMTANLACAGVVDHHLAWPRRFQNATVALIERSEVLRYRISQTRRARLATSQLYGIGEVRKPRHAPNLGRE